MVIVLREIMVSILNGTTTTSTNEVNDIIRSWRGLPAYFLSILQKAFLFLVYAAMFLGAFMIIWGVIEWMSGWNEHSGKRNVVRGIILLVVSMAPTIVR